MRILLYGAVDPADPGGVQQVVRRLAAHLEQRGHTVLLGWKRLDPAGGDVPLTLPLLQWTGRAPAPRSLLRAAAALWVLGAKLARWRPDVVNVHFVTSHAAYFAILRPLLRYKLVLSVHGSDVLRPKPWNAALVPRLLEAADAVTTVSSLTAAKVSEAPRMTPRRVRTIPNGIDYEFWSTAGPAADLASRDPVVISVGRLHPVKGQDLLLHALRAVRTRVPCLRAVLIGEGGWRAHLVALAQDLGVADIVEFTGHLEPTAVRARLREARLFVLPSRSEGLPLSLLEGMAAGIPVLAASVGGVPEVLVPGTGTLVPPDDAAVLAGAMVALLGDPVRAGAQVEPARRRAREFSAAAADAAYGALFDSLTT